MKSRLCFNLGKNIHLSLCLYALDQLKIPGYWELMNWLNRTCAAGGAQWSPNLYYLQTTFPILFNKIAFQFNASLPLDDHKP